VIFLKDSLTLRDIGHFVTVSLIPLEKPIDLHENFTTDYTYLFIRTSSLNFRNRPDSDSGSEVLIRTSDLVSGRGTVEHICMFVLIVRLTTVVF